MPASNLRRLRVTDQFNAVGCGVVMKDASQGSNAEGSSFRIGVVKYFTVKWRRYYIQLIDASAAELEALRPQKLPSLRDAKELAESLAISLAHGDVQLSRSATDRLWIDPEDLQTFVIQTGETFAVRFLHERVLPAITTLGWPDAMASRRCPDTIRLKDKERSWYACSICGYQVPKGSIRWARESPGRGSERGRGGSPVCSHTEIKESPHSCPTPEEVDDRQRALQRFHNALGSEAGDTVMQDAPDSGDGCQPTVKLEVTGGDQVKKESEEQQAGSEDEDSVQPLQCCNCRNVFHGDCLLAHEKLLPPDGMDEVLQFRNLDT